MPVAVVTDSTAYLPADVVADWEIGIVPLQVEAGGARGGEGVDVFPDDVRRELAERRAHVVTSMPAPAAFLAAWDDAARRGADAVVSVHLSAALSGTVAAASVAAAHAAVPVTVVDGRNTAMGLGFAVLAAARCAANGATACSVMEAATGAIARTRTFLYVDTLEHLRRGGRIGAAGALLGTALSVKPILHVVDGEIALLDRCRTATRAIARLTELVVAEAGDGPVDLAVHHLGTPGRARQLASQLAERLPALRDLYLSEVGAVVGAHAGPGLLGAVVHRRR